MIKKLHGITVCVDFSDLLVKSLYRWKAGLDRLIVATSSADVRTQELCKLHGVEVFVTDVFYYGGSSFNKGAALSAAIHECGWRTDADWLLSFDADIVPPPDWRETLNRQQLISGTLYGARRYWVPETDTEFRVDPSHLMFHGNEKVFGFFMLFAAGDRRLPAAGQPVFDMGFRHAGNYDTVFAQKWPDARRVLLSAPEFIHVGDERSHWMGRGNKKALEAVMQRRRALHGDLTAERLPTPPVLRAIGFVSAETIKKYIQEQKDWDENVEGV